MKPPAPQTMPEKLAIDSSRPSKLYASPLFGRVMADVDSSELAVEMLARWNSHDSLVRQRDALAEALKDAEVDLSQTFNCMKFNSSFRPSEGQKKRLEKIRAVLFTLKPEGAEGE